MTPIDHRKATRRLLLAYGVSLFLFALWPTLDLRVSALFHTEGAGFTLAAVPALHVLRETVWNLSIAMFALSLGALGLAAFGRAIPGFEARTAGFVFLLYLLGPILLVNGLLKRFWGRARPADITEFGGSREFTPPWLPADQCAANCSFVSGEGSAATALLLSLLVLAPALRGFLPPAAFRVYLGLAILLPAMGIALRVATGRHFLSDTVFAVLFVLTIALVLHRLLLTPRTP
ncbi:phosphatase PAP2 family protein [Albidovulum aquaemixtae]|uniref:phosphatase PAP2 family protein n=1 Tax=Albidovulum aquaemixtae TaxID=1542388 RepID=UPI0015E7FBB2|nr:phosphatase PAP2 family protein [Defluviimonas aquaemixtae]